MKTKKILIIGLVIYTLIGILISVYSISTMEYINPCGDADIRPGEIAGVCPQYIGDKSFIEKFEVAGGEDMGGLYIFAWPLIILQF